MAGDLVTFLIDGSRERNGAIPADAFLSKLRTFISTLYAFERAFSKKEKRQLDLEIVDLSRASPGQVQMRPRARAQGFPVGAALEWSFDQLDRIYNGQPVDLSIPQTALDSVVELASARAAKLPELGLLRAKYNGHIIEIDDVLASRAMALRSVRAADTLPPWRAGVSRGSLFGELRGIVDFEGERQFFIVPPSGPNRVQCVFSEDLRPAMVERLFKVVRARGFLHYDGNSPFPYMLDADAIDGFSKPEGHFLDLRGLFKGLEPSSPDEHWLDG